MQMRLLFLTALLCAVFSAEGQNAPLPEDSTAYEQAATYPYFPLDPRGGDIPFRRNLKSFCPRPSDQGNTNRCVGDALAHLLAICVSQRCQIHSPGEHAFSASFIFNLVKLDEKGANGAYVSHGLKLLKDTGDCSRAFFSNAHPVRKKPGKEVVAKALPFRIALFEKLFSTKAPYREKLDQLRTSLANNQPVVVAMFVPADFKNRKHPIDADAWSSRVPKNGHAMVLVGYDEETRTFEILNSYGNQWGDKGFFKIGYDDLVANLGFAYHIELPEDFRCAFDK